MFSVAYQPLLGTQWEWARIACLPWDEAIFGFSVADLRLEGAPPEDNPNVLLREALRAFSELISTRAED